MTKLERILLNLPPVKFLTEKSKHIILPGFDKVPLYDVILFFLSQVKKVGLTERAAAVAYNFIMAIPPTCLFIFTLIPQLPFIPKETIELQLHHLINDIIPAKEYNQGIIDFVDGFLNQPRVGLISFGFFLLIFFASNGMMGLMRSFNKNYIGFEKRSDLESRWMAIKLTFIILGLLVACLILLAMQGVVLRWLGVGAKWAAILSLFRWVLIVGLVFYAIAFIYKYAPAMQKRWKLLSPGSILATFLSLLATLGFSFFVSNFGKYNALYGSIGTIIVAMTLIYINALVLLIGYELNVSIHSLKALADERARHETSGVTVP
ncbi:YihY/virulence factor BrkB family protein [Pseudobacter ginsenosidimutans]|jgi:membrane protein|uniref:Membrane protein n=1 Tax=Pseudobacter ginsenosidimutans TaxID=661488 RepID=A0A4Q7N604_9BACT|nr:YihY/virulence factor BrkB family protein [Pseudobacter ginsenosidimutans]QEC45003.1 YihY/virulence factor BrkB family protein [Pseudobacter ginsenosidimutans]RZS76498.1 membrane protein [Pseudobacter ginsenosidimutans]